ncbi:hypothetical protein BJ165DRAFT_1426344 [Panaeolus papilionaceus]|nr:hypothetical protein BJ165DRAFT_1426344 [Panaeolus papilionaceus]
MSRDNAARTMRTSQHIRGSCSPPPLQTTSKIGQPRVSRADSGVDMTYSMYRSRDCGTDRHARTSPSDSSCQSRATSSPRRPPRSSRPPTDRRSASHSERYSTQRVSTIGNEHCSCAFCNEDDKTLHKLYDVDQLYLTEGAIHYNECLDSSEDDSDEGFYDSSPMPIEEQLLVSGPAHHPIFVNNRSSALHFNLIIFTAFSFFRYHNINIDIRLCEPTRCPSPHSPSRRWSLRRPAVRTSTTPP